jgi:hypothetical protein
MRVPYAFVKGVGTMAAETTQKGATQVRGAATKGAKRIREAAGERARELRASAIAPLPLPSFTPAALRRLEWSGNRESAIFAHATARTAAAETVRRLSSQALDPSERNELGCAYAVLAWVEHSDEHWLRAIQELRAARDDVDADDELEQRVESNLAAVDEAIGFHARGSVG